MNNKKVLLGTKYFKKKDDVFMGQKGFIQLWTVYPGGKKSFVYNSKTTKSVKQFYKSNPYGRKAFLLS